jgi:hypothetical protein
LNSASIITGGFLANQKTIFVIAFFNFRGMRGHGRDERRGGGRDGDGAGGRREEVGPATIIT